MNFILFYLFIFKKKIPFYKLKVLITDNTINEQYFIHVTIFSCIFSAKCLFRPNLVLLLVGQKSGYQKNSPKFLLQFCPESAEGLKYAGETPVLHLWNMDQVFIGITPRSTVNEEVVPIRDSCMSYSLQIIFTK